MLAFSAKRQQAGSGSNLRHLAGRPKRVPAWVDGAVRAVRRSGVPFAVAGGLAANNYMPPRNTDDFDIAVRLADLEAAGAAITAAGWDCLGDLSLYGGLKGTAWKDASENELDLLGLPGELGIKAIADAQGNPITSGLPTLTLPYLVTLKLIAARPIDTGDLSRMLGLADDTAIAQTRLVVRRFLPDDLPEFDQFVLLGRLEYPPDPDAAVTRPSAPVGQVRCRACGKVLKGEAARRAGIGETCARNERRKNARPRSGR